MTLIATLVVLKAKTPTLPEEQPIQKAFVWGLVSSVLSYVGIIALILSGIVEGDIVANIRVIAQMVFSIINKVIFPAYYIVRTPNLYEYVCQVFQNFLITPLFEVKSRVLQAIDFFTPNPNQIDVIV